MGLENGTEHGRHVRQEAGCRDLHRVQVLARHWQDTCYLSASMPALRKHSTARHGVYPDCRSLAAAQAHLNRRVPIRVFPASTQGSRLRCIADHSNKKRARREVTPQHLDQDLNRFSSSSNSHKTAIKKQATDPQQPAAVSWIPCLCFSLACVWQQPRSSGSPELRAALSRLVKKMQNENWRGKLMAAYLLFGVALRGHEKQAVTSNISPKERFTTCAITGAAKTKRKG